MCGSEAALDPLTSHLGFNVSSYLHGSTEAPSLDSNHLATPVSIPCLIPYYPRKIILCCLLVFQALGKNHRDLSGQMVKHGRKTHRLYFQNYLLPWFQELMPFTIQDLMPGSMF